MISSQRIQEAIELVEWIRVSVHDRTLTANERILVSAPCFAITQDHHHAIVLLIDHRLYASSFALLRIAFEAYVRGVWLSLCATDNEITKFENGWEPPHISKLLEAVEITPGFTEKVLSRIKTQSWKAMCDFTHTGSLHIQRWSTSEAIEPNYSAQEVEEVLQLSEILAIMSVIGLAEVIGDDALAHRVHEKFLNFRNSASSNNASQAVNIRTGSGVSITSKS
jgi:hypothetical protein